MQNKIILDGLSNSILECSDDLVVCLDLDFNIAIINGTATNILNITRDNAVGQNFFALCENREIELSFTQKELTYLKSLRYRIFNGYIILHKKLEERTISWKHIFVSNPQKEDESYFLIFGKDISNLEKYKKEAALAVAYLNNILENLPEYIYWKDLDLVYQGCNKHVSDSLGLSSPKEMIGKTDKDFGWDEERVQALYEIDKKILTTGIPNIVEEVVPHFDGSQRAMLSNKSPLIDTNGNIIGIVGVSVDITDYKRAEHLTIENKLQKAKLKEQENFKKIVDQVVHDIRSPLASLLMIVKSYEHELPEQPRVALREAALNIGSIANNMLSKYKDHDYEIVTTQEHQPVIVSLTLLQIISEKTHQYHESSVKITYDFCPDCDFIFIAADIAAVKRMLSNLINNAIDALEANKDGVVQLTLAKSNNYAKISIQDNGKGMPQEIIDKIMNNIPVTSGKKHGHGIGFTQIWEALNHNQGKIAIDSQVGQGTNITLSFPMIPTPEWIATKIKLHKGDTVIILDDDNSIHHAWEARFKEYKDKIKLQHFILGREAIKFINKIRTKKGIFLLVDFALLQQELNGLHVIEKTKIKCSILVTSHYGNVIVRNLALKSGAKILPKPLASVVPIIIEEENSASATTTTPKTTNRKPKNNKQHTAAPPTPNIVLIDDNPMFVDSLAMLLDEQGKIVAKYYKPTTFLQEADHFPKDTMIFMDNEFNDKITGIELAHQLHIQGYTNLYLLTGKKLSSSEAPPYLTVVLKTDIDHLYRIVDPH